MQPAGQPRFLNPDSLVFLTFVSLGAAVIFWVKGTWLSQTWTTVAVVALVVVYAVVVQRDRSQLRLDQAGDNTYYLGLIFTLLSMSSALVDVGNAARTLGPGSSVAEVIIGDFGVALFSTLAGIVMRLILQHMRVDPGGIEEATRLELALAAGRVRDRLNDMSIDLGEFHNVLKQRQQDYVEELAESCRDVVKDVNGLVTSVGESAAKAIQGAASEVATGLARFAATSEQLSRAMEDTSNRLISLPAPPARLAQRYEELAEKIDNVAGEMQTSGRRLSDGMEQVRKSAEVLSVALEALNRASAQAETQVLAGRTMAQRLEDGVTAQIEALTDVAGRVEKVAERFEGDAVAMGDRVSQVERAAVDVVDGFARVVESLDGRVKDGQ